MKKKIFRSVFFTAVLATLLASGLILAVLYGVFDQQIRLELREEARYMARALEQAQDDEAYLDQVDASTKRITWIGADGGVLFDNAADVQGMENHLDRPEIQAALEGGAGESQRQSETLGQVTSYYAIRLADGSVLRLASNQSSILGLLGNMVGPLVIILFVIALLSAILAERMAKQITIPINQMDLEEPLNNNTYDELAPLLLRMEGQTHRIREQMADLTKQQRAFAAVTENMSEGLVVLDAQATILSINESACKAFAMQKNYCIGRHILALNRSAVLQETVEKAQQGEKAQAVFQWKGKYYQLFANPVVGEEGEEKGIVLLALDVTERQTAEIMRKEFTANVSHELKTPLTSISGYAEIMKNGLAKPEDMQAFAGRISDETARLITLVNDILKLSRLDEQAFPQDREEVDLLRLSQDICERLQTVAEEKGVLLTAEGEHLSIPGVRQVLDEMLYNLCDNGIKYNREGGRVDVRIARHGDMAAVTVTDTGIGIPYEHQQKVFERFYRVDKSHSKATGGTGLGLSIVKHGAALHQAQIRLESTQGKGTAIQLLFPLKPEK